MSHMNFSDAFETVSALEKRKKTECILYIFAIFVKDLGKVKMLGLKYSIFLCVVSDRFLSKMHFIRK